MTEAVASLLRLMAWLSPAFPVGSFSYSHGLERAVHDELIGDKEGLAAWIETLLSCGSAWNDALLFAEAWRRTQAGEELDDLAGLAEALAGSRERHMETMLQGAAFMKAAAAWGLPRLPEDCAYCVAVGAVAGMHSVSLRDALAAYLQAFASNLVQAAIRLGVTGQADGVAVVARLEPVLLDTAARAANSSLDDLGSATLLSEIAAMKHETQYSRLFRT